MIQETNLKPYTIYHSENHSFPLVVSIPHSGTQLTREMQETLLPDVVLSNMDCNCVGQSNISICD